MTLRECYPVQQVCRVLELPRSSYYYQARSGTEPQRELEATCIALSPNGRPMAIGA
jgi:hypothetical protein